MSCRWFYDRTSHLQPMWRYFHGVLGDLKTVLGEWACKEFLLGKAWASFFLPFPLVSWSAIDCVLSPIHSTPAFPVRHSWVTFSGARQVLKTAVKAKCWRVKIFLRPWNSFFPPWNHQDFPPPHQDQKPRMSLFGVSLHLQGRLSFLWKWKQKLAWRGSTYWKVEREPGVSERNLLWFIFKCISLHLHLWKACDTPHLRRSSILGNQSSARSNLWASK